MVCVVLFLVVFIGKGVFPDKVEAVREQLLSTLHSDTDFRAAFVSLGRSISEGEGCMGTGSPPVRSQRPPRSRRLSTWPMTALRFRTMRRWINTI